jgi:CubicO group peptidase (beta-lactamase class C family)
LKERVDELFKVYDDSRKQMHIPGMGMVIITPTKPGDMNRDVHIRGFGVASEKTQEPINADTIFCVASTTKLFNAHALGILVDQQKLDWEAPIKNYSKVFFKNQTMADNVNLIDLLSHRTGFARHDSLTAMNVPPSQIFELYQSTDPVCEFRNSFVYSNIMQSFAGSLANHALGIASEDAFEGWRQIVEREIFAKLGMSRSFVRYEDFHRQTNKASRHIFNMIKNTTRELSDDSSLPAFRNDAPAGAIATTLSDFSKWLSYLLDASQLKSNSSILSRKSHDVIFSVHNSAVHGDKSLIGNASYGLSVHVRKYRNKLVYFHGGDREGMKTLFCVFPEDNIASVMMWNGQLSKEDLCNDFADQLIFFDEISQAGAAMKRIATKHSEDSNAVSGFLQQNQKMIEIIRQS